MLPLAHLAARGEAERVVHGLTKKLSKAPAIPSTIGIFAGPLRVLSRVQDYWTMRFASRIGDSGTGKSHLLLGLGTAAAEKGFEMQGRPRVSTDLH
jgi:hypothetical protein